MPSRQQYVSSHQLGIRLGHFIPIRRNIDREEEVRPLARLTRYLQFTTHQFPPTETKIVSPNPVPPYFSRGRGIGLLELGKDFRLFFQTGYLRQYQKHELTIAGEIHPVPFPIPV